MKAGPGDCASVAGKIGPSSVQDCKDVLCLRGVCTVDGDDCLAVVKDAMTFTKVKTEKTGVENWLEEGRNCDLSGFQFGIARDVRRGLRVVQTRRVEKEKRTGKRSGCSREVWVSWRCGFVAKSGTRWEG